MAPKYEARKVVTKQPHNERARARARNNIRDPFTSKQSTYPRRYQLKIHKNKPLTSLKALSNFKKTSNAKKAAVINCLEKILEEREPQINQMQQMQQNQIEALPTPSQKASGTLSTTSSRTIAPSSATTPRTPLPRTPLPRTPLRRTPLRRTPLPQDAVSPPPPIGPPPPRRLPVEMEVDVIPPAEEGKVSNFKNVPKHRAIPQPARSCIKARPFHELRRKRSVRLPAENFGICLETGAVIPSSGHTTREYMKAMRIRKMKGEFKYPDPPEVFEEDLEAERARKKNMALEEEQNKSKGPSEYVKNLRIRLHDATRHCYLGILHEPSLVNYMQRQFLLFKREQDPQFKGYDVEELDFEEETKQKFYDGLVKPAASDTALRTSKQNDAELCPLSDAQESAKNLA